MLNVVTPSAKKYETTKLLQAISIVIIPDLMETECSFCSTANFTLFAISLNMIVSYAIPNISW